MRKVLVVSVLILMMFVSLIGCFNSDGLKFGASFGGGSRGGGSGTLLRSFPKVFYHNNDYISSNFSTISITSDGGIVLGGTHQQYINNNLVIDALFVKIDSSGQTLWKKLGSIGKHAFSFFEWDGYYYSTGTARVDNQDKAYVTKLDQNGNTVKILYFDASEGYGNLLPIQNNPSDYLILLYTNRIAKIDTDLNIRWVARMDSNHSFATYNNATVSAFPYYGQGNTRIIFFAVNSYNNPPGICRMDLTSDDNIPSSVPFKQVVGLEEIRSIYPGHNNDIIVLGVDQANNLGILKLNNNLNQITTQKVYSHNLVGGFGAAFVLPGWDDKYLLVVDSYSMSGTVIVTLKSNFTIDKTVVLNMQVRSALPIPGGYIFAGRIENGNDAVIMSLDSLLNPFDCPTIIDTEINVTFQEVGSQLSLQDSSISLIPGNFNPQPANTPTTDAGLQEDTNCRTNWIED